MWVLRVFHAVLCLFIVLNLTCFSVYYVYWFITAAGGVCIFCPFKQHLKINYCCNVLLSACSILITWTGQMIPFIIFLFLELCVCCLFFPLVWDTKSKDPLSSASCMLTNINSLFSVRCCNMQNKTIQVQHVIYLSLFFFSLAGVYTAKILE